MVATPRLGKSCQMRVANQIWAKENSHSQSAIDQYDGKRLEKTLKRRQTILLYTQRILVEFHSTTGTQSHLSGNRWRMVFFQSKPTDGPLACRSSLGSPRKLAIYWFSSHANPALVMIFKITCSTGSLAARYSKPTSLKTSMKLVLNSYGRKKMEQVPLKVVDCLRLQAKLSRELRLQACASSLSVVALVGITRRFPHFVGVKSKKSIECEEEPTFGASNKATNDCEWFLR